MQSAKDTFFLHLRERLVQLNPLRTVDLNGSTRPALVVIENEPPVAARLSDVFYLRWLGARVIARSYPDQRPLLALEAEFSYSTAGTPAQQHVDRGRLLAELDLELLAMCASGSTPLVDGTQSPAVSLGGRVFWDTPRLAAIEHSGDELRRTASITIFFFPQEPA